MKHHLRISTADFELLRGTDTIERMIRHKIVVDEKTPYNVRTQLSSYLAENCADIYYVVQQYPAFENAETAYYFADYQDFVNVLNFSQGD